MRSNLLCLFDLLQDCLFRYLLFILHMMFQQMCTQGGGHHIRTIDNLATKQWSQIEEGFKYLTPLKKSDNFMEQRSLCEELNHFCIQTGTLQKQSRRRCNFCFLHRKFPISAGGKKSSRPILSLSYKPLANNSGKALVNLFACHSSKFDKFHFFLEKQRDKLNKHNPN